jgi:hypothetical protein
LNSFVDFQYFRNQSSFCLVRVWMKLIDFEIYYHQLLKRRNNC